LVLDHHSHGHNPEAGSNHRCPRLCELLVIVDLLNVTVVLFREVDVDFRDLARRRAERVAVAAVVGATVGLG